MWRWAIITLLAALSAAASAEPGAPAFSRRQGVIAPTAAQPTELRAPVMPAMPAIMARPNVAPPAVLPAEPARAQLPNPATLAQQQQQQQQANLVRIQQEIARAQSMAAQQAARDAQARPATPDVNQALRAQRLASKTASESVQQRITSLEARLKQTDMSLGQFEQRIEQEKRAGRDGAPVVRFMQSQIESLKIQRQFLVQQIQAAALEQRGHDAVLYGR